MRRAGYSLVEILVAVLLMSIVFATAYLLLNSTRRVTTELSAKQLSATPLNAFETFSLQLRKDLDHAQGDVRPPDAKTPAFRLEQESDGFRVEWFTLSPDFLPLRCVYQFDGQSGELQRVTAALHTGGRERWQTNSMLSHVEHCGVKVHDGNSWQDQWPIGEKAAGDLPRLLSMEIQAQRETSNRVVHAVIPLSLKAER